MHVVSTHFAGFPWSQGPISYNKPLLTSGEAYRDATPGGGVLNFFFGRYVPRGFSNPWASELTFGQKRVLEN